MHRPPSWALRNTLTPYWVISYNLAQSWSIALVASLVILIVLTLKWAIGNDLAISSEKCLKFGLESKTPNWTIITDLVPYLRFGPPRTEWSQFSNKVESEYPKILISYQFRVLVRTRLLEPNPEIIIYIECVLILRCKRTEVHLSCPS